MKTGLAERAAALEGAFFARQDAELIEALRKHAIEEDLARATGIEDARLLELLTAEGIRVETLVALLLVPIVEIAWADHRVTTLERNTLHAELGAIGIRPTSPAGAIVERWIERGPPAGLMDAWERYVEELERTMSTDGFAELGDRITRMCRAEADSDGGVLRIGRRTSPEEKAVVARVEGALAML
mgnify:CR=1 FL=1